MMAINGGSMGRNPLRIAQILGNYFSISHSFFFVFFFPSMELSILKAVRFGIIAAIVNII